VTVNVLRNHALVSCPMMVNACVQQWGDVRP
jgi:hypothetical protein